jgi:hypothetical protein
MLRVLLWLPMEVHTKVPHHFWAIPYTTDRPLC